LDIPKKNLRDRIIDAVLEFEAKQRVRASIVVLSEDLFYQISDARDRGTPPTKVTVFDLPVGFSDEVPKDTLSVYRIIKRKNK